MNLSEENGYDAKAIKARAASWLERRDRDDWNSDDEAGLEAWLEESLANATAFWRLEGAWERTNRLSALREPMRASQSPVSSRSRNSLRWLAGGALLAVIGALGAGAIWTPKDKAYSTPVGGHEIITLADGSSVELNTDTSLRIGADGGSRLITLVRGEAYFQVTHDPDHPFVVNVAGHRVVDIGTKFLLRNDAQKVELALYEGRASFESTLPGAGKKKVILKPGDIAVAESNKPGFRIVSNEPGQMLVNKLAWQRGFLVMDHTTLATVASNLNRYNRQKISIEDRAAAGMEMYGTIPINGVEGFVRVAQGVLGLHVERHGNEIVISK